MVKDHEEENFQMKGQQKDKKYMKDIMIIIVMEIEIIEEIIDVIETEIEKEIIEKEIEIERRDIMVNIIEINMINDIKIEEVVAEIKMV